MNKYLIFTDCHGMFSELLQLLDKAGVVVSKGKIISSPYKKIINLGDYCCKGPQIPQIVDFLYDNQEWILNVVANHENFVVKYWREEIKNTEDGVLDFFNTVYIEDEEFRRKVCHLYDNSVPFVIGPTFICTHAPCHFKFLSKTDNSSLRAQRNFRYTHLSNEEIIKTVEDFYNHGMFTKTHIFGHIALKDIKIGRNFIALDTGAVFGNKLSAVTIGEEKPIFYQVDCKNYAKQEEKLLEWKKPEKFLSINMLDHREKRMVKMYAENGVNFISGTVSPSAIEGDKL